jgi:hypothetical protein
MALNSIAIPPDAARDQKARELAKTIGTWTRGTLTEPWGSFPAGTAYFVTPNGYRVNAVTCSCDDYRRFGHICKHVRAVVMADEQSAPKPRPAYADLFPSCAEPGCENDPESGERYCREHWVLDIF